jgi:transposase
VLLLLVVEVKVKMAEKKFFVGLDVHTGMTQYAVRAWNGNVISEGKTASRYADLKKILEPYFFSCVVGMEACTGFYPLRDGFLNDGVSVKVANVLRIRELVVKNDKLDALRLSDMLRLGSFPESFIPDKTLQALRDLVTLRHSFVEENVRTQSRIWAALTMHGIRIIKKSLFSKSGYELVKKLVGQPNCPVQLPLLLQHYEDTTKKLEEITKQMELYAQQHFQKEYEKLQTIDGIGPIISSYIIANVHPITRFVSQKKLRRYAGVIPCFQESAGKTYGSNLPKNSSRTLLRWALTLAAHHAIKKKTTKMHEYYKIKKQKCKQKAIMAVARMMCDKVFTTLTT